MFQFIGLVNYLRDHVPNMTEMAKPLRNMIPQGKYQRTGQARLDNRVLCHLSVLPTGYLQCQELYFLEDTAKPILQTDASDYGIDGYLYMVTMAKPSSALN